MPEMKTLNGYEVVDAKAREDIKGIQAAVEAIPEYDLTPYATKSELPTKVSQLQNDSKFITLEEVPETDLSEYAKKSELPTVPKKVSELTNDAGYITAAEVPKTDLSAYAKKADIPDVSGFITSIPSEYVTESELNAKGYLTQHQDISHLAPKTSIPTKVSQLANDSNYLTSIPSNYITEAELEAKGYLTEHQSLAAYATKTYVDNTVAENQPNLSGYAKKTDIPDVSGFISEIPSEYVTDSELAAKGYLVEADISEYAKKSEIPTVPTKTSQLTNDSNFLTAIPSEYITETELDNKGYLTEHQSLSEYAKKSEIPDVSHFITSIPEEYVTETELNNKGYLTQHQSLEGYATKTYVDDAIAGIDIPGGSNSSIVYLDIRSIGTSYEPAPQEAITLAKDLLAGKSLIVYLRTSDTEYRQADIKCGTSSVELFAAPKINVNNGDATQGICVIQNFGSNGVEDWHAYKAIDISPALVTQSELDNAIAGINIPEPDLTSYATKEYVNSTKLAILDIYNCNKVGESWQLTDNVKTIIQRLFAGERFPITVAPYSHTQYIPSSISITSNEIKIKLDTSHLYTSVGTLQLTGLQTDTYVFTNTSGYIELQITQFTLDVADAHEYSQQLAALEARVAALEGGTK